MSSESQAPADTWSSLITDLKEALLGENTPTPCSSEEEFRDNFESLCNDHNEPNAQRLLNLFSRQHGAITRFTNAIDDAQNLQPPDTLSDLFWQLAFATIQAALDADVSLKDIFEQLNPLNSALKPFGAQLAQFPTRQRVQEPLQAVFREYIECYSIMLSQFASHPPGLIFETFQSRVETASELFQNSLEDWKEVVKQIGEEEGTGSLPRLPHQGQDHLHPGVTTSTRFQWLEPLGTGTYGQVSKVREVTTGSIYAQKTIRVQNNHRARTIIENQVRNEVAIMHKLRHHHIAPVLFYVKDETTFSIIMLPVGDYDLRHFLEVKCEGFPRTETRHLDQWFGCLASALAFAHQERVKHEDIKPSNILIRDHQPYLADFGSAIDFSYMERSTSSDEHIVGTPVYWPPEPVPQRGRAADVFALGCVFSEMLTVRQHRSLQEYRDARYVPHHDNGYAFRTNLETIYTWLDALPDHGPAEVRFLLLEQTKGMLAADRMQRLEARDVKRNFRREGDALFCLSCA
ncbi:uncharacterized protein Z520_00991 [Fonsecaea multimorphosa CBS 102226]|uniref:Protein kinase domain-containing protein n=1 Tax=Fonsecaea multimorphosa CBS 102226 TaxID=1442371 RepID=A0A0D2HKV9_9EURO|nr:uncharacterized protein Z520_00991 [Fonsecaea multimorphosa CBS 102226]KIY02526.1 hypothetical protein Z520_00991 [Fonsecaea multimorphosa CBS 102226]